MKNIWKYVLSGLGVGVIYLVWITIFSDILNGLSWEAAATVGTGFFLSFEMVILSGIIITKINKK